MTTLPFSVPRELFEVEHRFVDLDGARIHYVEEGHGETLLLLHGNPTWSFLYRRIIAALRDSFRCVALDYRLRHVLRPSGLSPHAPRAQPGR